MGLVFLVVLVVLLYTFQSIFCKGYNENYSGEEALTTLTFTTATSLFIALVAFAFNGFVYKFDVTTFILGVANAAAFALYNKFFIAASTKGPYSVLMVFNLSGAIVVPTIINIFFDIKISPVQWLALVLVVGAIYMVSRKKNEQKASKGFWGSSIGIFLANGAYGTLLSVQQTFSERAGNPVGTGRGEMLITTFGVLGVFMIAKGLITYKKGYISKFKQNKKSGIYLLLSMIVMASATCLLSYLLTRMNATVLFTCDNSGVLLCSVAYSLLVYKEKMSALNIVGCLVMLAGIVGITGII